MAKILKEEEMNIFFYCIIFVIGILFGSFYTLAVYRIPRKEDITHTHSYCPNCNAKLGFFELIPVLSYIFLGGKCKHCGEKIRVRYILLEILSGLTFVAMAKGMNLNINTLTILDAVKYSFYCLYITFIFLIAGIDKEHRKIENSVINYGIVISILYMVYLYVFGHYSIYRYVIYAVWICIVKTFYIFFKKKDSNKLYAIGNILILVIANVFTNELITLLTTEFALISIVSYMAINKIKNIKNKTENNISENLKIGFFICTANCITFLTMLNISNM